MLEISKQVARRYVLGRQGVWPGRRWQGLEGVASAIRAAESVQVDTISVVARNHDLVLLSRVADYRPGWLEQLLYTERRFFEYGGILFIYPIDDLAHWQPIMGRSTRWRDRVSSEFPHLIEQVRERIRTDGPLCSRDFKGRALVPGGFNVVKDTTHALDYLWITGQALIHSRRGNDRVYQLTERLLSVPPSSVTMEEAEYFFAIKALRDLGLASSAELARRASAILGRKPSPTEGRLWLHQMEAEGIARSIKMEDRADTLYFPASDGAILEQLVQGEVPLAWTPLGNTTSEEVNFLAPLDNITWDRNRLLRLFDFDYIWEVYKPASIRRWGYYTLPILYGDRLVARLDPKLDRKTGRLSIMGFWLDDLSLAEDPDFASALSTGLRRFAAYHAATTVDLSVLAASPLAKLFVQ